MWEVKECKLSNLFFLSDGNDVYREEYGQKTWYFAAEAQEKADELNGVKVEIKTEYEEVGCDLWNIATLKDDFEAGVLYKLEHVNDDKPVYSILKTKPALSYNLSLGYVYRRIETPVTLESELQELFGDRVIYRGDLKEPKLLIMDLDLVKTDYIHQLSAILKKYGK